ncbi:hypothetical protein [Methylobacterium frigidaeris]|uniref:Uncharacterized protein n=1 Tax=Methylobacterium frigidaeris TaxID=2038277 RepID=A0AA37M6R1_9HYPH|nr:hypothetical protein [Methylobacterium frigidaeris]PIK71596.1 hypothetical protein CS379_18490 [Methylobacterium frigidaeris]GJD64031.1 hypothetical protein MPEAHAMD_4205 [Methylobacterium frigidaeris]
MNDPSTIGDLYERKRVTDEQIDAAVTNYLNDPVPGPRPLSQGLAIDVCAIMEANPHAREVLALRDATEAQMRMAVRTAILLAAPIWTAAATAAQDASATARRRRAQRSAPEDTAAHEK